MNYPDNCSNAEDYADDQLISGTVFLAALILMNVILLLNWLGYLSFA